MSSYILSLIFLAGWVSTGFNQDVYFIVAIIMLAAGDIRRQIKENRI